MIRYLSVVVPVYNVEDYLHKCIDSIINQTFTALEIILVNDGSSDGSPQICDEYAKKDVRVKVIHQQNAGVSVARNTGIEAAIGDYITFVDSDDWLQCIMYEEMCKITMSADASDVVMCDFKTVKNDKEDEVSAPIRKGFYSKSKIIAELYPTLLVTEDFGRIPIVSACICFFKRTLLIESKILFDATLKYSEDYLFMANVMVRANSFYYLKEHYYYNYRQYEESRSKKFQPLWWENLRYLNTQISKLLADNKEYDFTRQIKLQLLHSVLFVLNSISKNVTMNGRRKLQEIRLIMNDPAVKDAFSTLSFYQGSKMLKLVLHIIKYKMARTYLLLHLTTSIIKNA